jgi:hypothetical protein
MNITIIRQLNGFLYTLEPWRLYFYLKSKTSQWVADPTKYWVTEKSKYGDPMTAVKNMKLNVPQ